MLPPAEVRAERLFVKSEAGMKESFVDTLIILEKINLSLSDLLSENTPIFIKNHGRGALAAASFRGTAASHTQVTWNGININSPMAGMVDFSLIPVYVIDDLSLKYGTASIADNSGGIGGSISINNHVNWDNPFEIKYMQGVGSYSTYDEFLSFGIGNQKIKSKTRVYHSYSKNDYTFINRGIGEIDEVTGEIINPLDTNSNADFKKFGLLQELYFRPNSKNIFSVKYWGQFSDRTIPRATSYEGSENSNLNTQANIDHKIVADWKLFLGSNKIIARTGYSDKKVDYILMNQILGYGEFPAIYSQSHQKSFLNSIDYKHDFNEFLSLKSGVDFNFHDVSSIDTVIGSGYSKTRSELSYFISADANVFKRLNINLLVRQDFVDFDLQPIIPFLGIDYRIFKDKNLIFKANIARNYHLPSLNDLYWQPGGNPDLLSESGFTIESGLEYAKDYKNLSFSGEATAYRSDIDNWILWVPSFKGYWEPQNIQRVLSQGVETNHSIQASIKEFKFRISGSYAYTSSINYGDTLVWGDQSYGKQLVYIPLHSGNVLFNVSFKGFYLTYQHNSYSERFTTSSNDITQRDWLYPYFMNDLIVGKSFKLKELNCSVEFKVYNLFNETYHSVLYRPMPKRNYMLMLMIGL
jgi:iron complex outermembrane receptor protein